MSQKSKWEYLKAIYTRYRKASKKLRALILNEFCQVCGYNRKYAIRLLNGPAPQKPTARHKTRPPELPRQGDLRAQSDLGSRGLPLLPASQGCFASVAAMGAKAFFPLCSTPKATAFDQPLHHRSAAQGQKTAAQKKTLGAHQAGHASKAPHPYQDRLLERDGSRLHRDRSGLALGQLRKGRVHPFAQRHRHLLNLGGNQLSAIAPGPGRTNTTTSAIAMSE